MPVAKAPDSSPLVGNWLLTEKMPSSVVSPGVDPGVRLAMTLDVEGNVISAVGEGEDGCDGNITVGFDLPPLNAGAVAAYGSFEIQSSSNVGTGFVKRFSVQGHLPQEAGGAWSGNYSMDIEVDLLSSSGQPKCKVSRSGAFTATYFPLLDGTYEAKVDGLATSGSDTDSRPPAPTSLQVTLKQGGDAASTATPLRVTEAIIPGAAILTGSIRAEGSECFASGEISSGNMVGNHIAAMFLMDDGSQLQLSTTVTDVTEQHLERGVATVHGGKCGGDASAPYIFSFAESDRKS